jgi:hypothetical protein
MMSTAILQSLKLKFNLCMEKQKRQIVLRGKLNQIVYFRGWTKPGNSLGGYPNFDYTWG